MSRKARQTTKSSRVLNSAEFARQSRKQILRRGRPLCRQEGRAAPGGDLTWAAHGRKECVLYLPEDGSQSANNVLAIKRGATCQTGLSALRALFPRPPAGLQDGDWGQGGGPGGARWGWAGSRERAVASRWALPPPLPRPFSPRSRSLKLLGERQPELWPWAQARTLGCGGRSMNPLPSREEGKKGLDAHGYQHYFWKGGRERPSTANHRYQAKGRLLCRERPTRKAQAQRARLPEPPPRVTPKANTAPRVTLGPVLQAPARPRHRGNSPAACAAH